ncbi:MAG: CBS domain-containing protein [Euryarchaeota archaeon]|mgnify:FL=1|nr:CBS domain-containing protein [Euryarchaeota archaeon]MBT5254597.1 CBS domain-containing protein [Euryarchaeota archaeon]MDG1546850.1 CBS domain-containing protein [Candidatus Poseidoniaceae archaeon]
MEKTVADLKLDDEHITAGLNDSIQEGANRLLSVPGGVLIVLDDENKVKGVIGTKQMLTAISKGSDVSSTKCGEIMEMDFLQVELDTSLSDVLSQIKKRSPQAVVAVDNGGFAGYFSPSDYNQARTIVKSLKQVFKA